MRTKSNNVLVVANEAQRIIFESEMKGQLSDGMWENSSPCDHWMPWCDAEVILSDENNDLGRNFYACKSNYDFANSELLKGDGDWDGVGPRIIFKVKAHMLLELQVEQLGHSFPDSVEDYDNRFKYVKQDAINRGADDKLYWQGKIDALTALGIDRAKLLEIEASDVYTMKQLFKDCRELKIAARTHNR